MGQAAPFAPLIDISSAKIGSKLEWAKGDDDSIIGWPLLFQGCRGA